MTIYRLLLNDTTKSYRTLKSLRDDNPQLAYYRLSKHTQTSYGDSSRVYDITAPSGESIGHITKEETK